MTQIQCIYCQTNYEIDDEKINNKKKKIRCAKCKKVFTFQRSQDDNTTVIVNAVEEEPILEKGQNTEIKNEDIAKEEPQLSTTDIFARLNKELEKCNKEEEPEKIDIKNQFKNNLKSNKWFYICSAIIALLLLLNLYKFEISRSVPFMRTAYTSLGVNSVVEGEGLKFINVSKESIVENNNNNYMNIKGYISNETNSEILIPTIIVNILDANGNLLYTTQTKASSDKIAAKQRGGFSKKIKNPPKTAHYVYLTFTE